jgi:hypothetical protein
VVLERFAVGAIKITVSPIYLLKYQAFGKIHHRSLLNHYCFELGAQHRKLCIKKSLLEKSNRDSIQSKSKPFGHYS